MSGSAPTVSSSWTPSSYPASGYFRYGYYHYTANGQQDYVLDANNNRTNYAFDGLDRLHTHVGNDPGNKTDSTGLFCWSGSFGNSCNGSTQSVVAWLGQNLWRTSDARSSYADKAQSLNPRDAAARTEGKGSARAGTPEPARSIVQAMRPDEGSRTGSTSGRLAGRQALCQRLFAPAATPG